MGNRGSEWSRWDLHVHSPASLVQHYGEGGGDPWESFLKDLEQLPTEFRAIGLNDYLFLDGYKRVLQERNSGRVQNLPLILPVLELRLNHFGGTDSDLSRVNLHVIFSDELTPEVIESQFIARLRCDLALVPAEAGAQEWSAAPTRESLASLGRKIRDAAPAHLQADYTEDDLTLGFNNYNVTFECVLEALANPVFHDKHFLAIGKAEWADVKWTNQSIGFKRTLINRPHFVFTATDTPAAFGRSRQSLEHGGVNATLLDCSDSHSLSTSSHSNRIGNCLTWINALPTFEGLRHAYYEYQTRVFIGDRPPKLTSVGSAPGHYMASVHVVPSPEGRPSPELNADLELNPGLVAIVGNKGQGKSALTDVLGLLGGSRRSRYFSFLRPERFCEPKHNPAARHEASLTWCSGAEAKTRLDEAVAPSTPEQVQYLPQSYLEEVCDEGPGSDAFFSRELSAVIFSHVPEADRLGKSTLEDLVELSSNAARRKLEILRGELRETNRRIAELEQQLDPLERDLVLGQLGEKQQELALLDSSKPAPIAAPADASSVETEGNLEQIRSQIVELEASLRSIRDAENANALVVSQCDSVTKQLDNFQYQFELFGAQIAPDLKALGLEQSALISLTTNTSAIVALRDKAELARGSAQSQLKDSVEGSPAALAMAARSELARLESELDAPRRAYQTYLSDLSAWEKLRLDLVGGPAVPDSLSFYEDRLRQLDSLPDVLDDLKASRTARMLAIYAELLEISETLRSLYRPVQAFIDGHPVVASRFDLSFEVALVAEQMEDRFFLMVSRQASGSFSGVEEGSARLRELIATAELDTETGLTAFVELVEQDLHVDNRDGRKTRSTVLAQQLRKSVTTADLYDFLYGLEWLSPEFWLRSGSRTLAQLSPGQRGTLLLLFYLLVDRSQRPILLDQPEGNLDNHTIHDLLVPAINEARQRRQVVVVTHNPNLAVVGDADQIVIADLIDDRFKYSSGAIEDPGINSRLVEILEGTWPAFRNRQDKYTPTSVAHKAN